MHRHVGTGLIATDHAVDVLKLLLTLNRGYMWNKIMLKQFWNYFGVLFHMQPRLKLK